MDERWLLLGTDAGQAAAIASSATAVPADVVIEETLNSATAKISSGAGVIGDRHVGDSRHGRTWSCEHAEVVMREY